MLIINAHREDGKCSSNGCQNLAKFKGLCIKHYSEYKRIHVEGSCCKRCKIVIPKHNWHGYCSNYCKDWEEFKECLNCGKKVLNEDSRTSKFEKRYCSKQCMREHQKPVMPSGFCEHCGVYFVRKIKRQVDSARFCSRECAFEHKSENSKPKKPKSCLVWFFECKQCKKIFASRSEKSIYCSRSCHSKWRYDNDIEYKTAHNTRSRNRRAMKRSAVIHKNIEIKILAKRDKHICGLCGEKVDLRHRWPHPMSGSIDHIMPLTKGGLHEWGNVQLAHLRCNLSKRASIPKIRRGSLFEFMSNAA